MDQENKRTACLYFSLAMCASRLHLYCMCEIQCCAIRVCINNAHVKKCLSSEVRQEKVGGALEVSMELIYERAQLVNVSSSET